MTQIQTPGGGHDERGMYILVHDLKLYFSDLARRALAAYYLTGGDPMRRLCPFVMQAEDRGYIALRDEDTGDPIAMYRIRTDGALKRLKRWPEEFEMKAITLTDTLTGEQLEIEIDLEADKMKINGEPVVRKRALESSKDQFVYGPPGPGPTEIYHLDRQQIEQMKATK